MARPLIHPSILADKGVPLELLGGRQVSLCYGFQALMLLEERFGSLQGALDIVNGFEQGVADSKAITGLVGIMACGLAHEHGDDGEDLSHPEHLGYYLDTKQIAGYGKVIGEAFTKAFPDVTPAQEPDGEEEAADPTVPSRGASGTGGRGSTSPSPTTSSGA